jgi:preprotein translocase subunit SecE
MSHSRLVNITFMSAAVLLWVITAKFVAGTLEFTMPEWDLALIGREFRISDLIGLSCGVLGGILLWRHETVFQLTNEVASEVRKITWPSTDETRLSTIVVVVTTIIIASCLWIFDVLFSALTKMFYSL